jgi:hypothetical protein
LYLQQELQAIQEQQAFKVFKDLPELQAPLGPKDHKAFKDLLV